MITSRESKRVADATHRGPDERGTVFLDRVLLVSHDALFHYRAGMWCTRFFEPPCHAADRLRFGAIACSLGPRGVPVGTRRRAQNTVPGKRP